MRVFVSVLKRGAIALPARHGRIADQALDRPGHPATAPGETMTDTADHRRRRTKGPKARMLKASRSPQG
jgi:hypothetical protein